jgi:hypothetical protein
MNSYESKLQEQLNKRPAVMKLVAAYLSATLPEGYVVEEREAVKSVRISHGKATYLLEIRARMDDGVFVKGEQYLSNNRWLTPVLKVRADGNYNLEAVKKHVISALAYRARKMESINVERARFTRSLDTLAAIREVKPAGESDKYETTYETDTFKIVLTAGSFNDGLVHVDVRPKKSYVTAQEAIALLNKFGA